VDAALARERQRYGEEKTEDGEEEENIPAGACAKLRAARSKQARNVWGRPQMLCSGCTPSAYASAASARHRSEIVAHASFPRLPARADKEQAASDVKSVNGTIRRLPSSARINTNAPRHAQPLTALKEFIYATMVMLRTNPEQRITPQGNIPGVAKIKPYAL